MRSNEENFLKRLIIVSIFLFHVGCGPESQSPSSAPSLQTTSPPPQTPMLRFREMSVQELKPYRVMLTTTFGNMEIELLPEQATETVRQFLYLCQLGVYDKTTWHRVIRGSFIQGGDLSTRRPALSAAELERLNRRLPLETSKLKHEPGTVSMARSDVPGSAETSFFICLSKQPSLDGKYSILGKLVTGLEVAEKISNVALDRNKPRQRWELVKAEVTSLTSWPRSSQIDQISVLPRPERGEGVRG
jgi:peptidyl-prolyl cis-trans isomerase B (cyclophilin B)